MRAISAILILAAFVFIGGISFAVERESGREVAATVAHDIQMYPKCRYSGMDRAVFAHTRMLIQYTDGSEAGTGSLRCASIDLVINFMKTVKSVQVGDYNTKKLIDAEKAYWVIGGKVPGVMTQNAKWAFAERKDAEAFIKDNGGEISSYDEALAATYAGMFDDTLYLNAAMKNMKGHGHNH